MPAGIQVIGDHGIQQIDEYNQSLVFTGNKGSVTTIASDFGGSDAKFSIVSASQPILVVRSMAGGTVTVLNNTKSSNTWTYWFNIDAAVGTKFEWYQYDLSSNVTSSGNYGLQIFNAAGELAYSSNQRECQVVGVFPNANAGSITLSSDRQYGVIVSTFCTSQETTAYPTGDPDYGGQTWHYTRTLRRHGAYVKHNYNGTGTTVAGVGAITRYDSGNTPNDPRGSYAPNQFTSIVVDLTGTGALAPPIALQTSFSNPDTQSTSNGNGTATFSQTINATGGPASYSYSWSIESPTGGTWSIASGQGTKTVSVSVTNVPPFETGSASLRCTVTSGTSSSTNVCSLSCFNTGGIGVTVGPSQTRTGSTQSYTFSPVTCTVTGGTPTSYTWDGGDLAIVSGQGTSTVTVRATAVTTNVQHTYTLQCTTVVKGFTFTRSCTLRYTWSAGTSPPGPTPPGPIQ